MKSKTTKIDIFTLNIDKLNDWSVVKRNDKIKENNFSSLHRKRGILRVNHLLKKMNYYQPFNKDISDLELTIIDKKEKEKFEPKLPEQEELIEEFIIKVQKESPKPIPKEPPKESSKELSPIKELIKEENIPQSNTSDTKVNSDVPSYKEKLIEAANNFVKIKPKIKELMLGDIYSTQMTKIMDTLGPLTSQINESSVIESATTTTKKCLKEVEAFGKKELYLITIDNFLNLLFSKSHFFVTQLPQKIFNITKVLNLVNSSTLTNLFFQKICYSCPYVIPVAFSKTDFPEAAKLKERQGLREDEDVNGFNCRMESFEYLYFTFLRLNYKKYRPLVIDYLHQIEKINFNLPLALGNSFKVFLDVFGNILEGEGFFQKIKNISEIIKQKLEASNKKSTNTDTKSINSANIFKIKKHLKNIASKKPTDLYTIK